MSQARDLRCAHGGVAARGLGVERPDTETTGWVRPERTGPLRRVAGVLPRLGLGAAVAALLVVATPAAASAHPLGNFTVNRYSGVVVAADSVSVDHVLDLAEIPTAQRRPEIDTSGDGRLSKAELAGWARGACTDAAGRLQLSVGGGRASLSVASAAARTLPGQAGLPTLRLECRLTAPASITSTTTVRLVDTAAGDQVGWREMTAAGDGTTLARSDVPRHSRSGRLSSYPKDLLSSPLDVRSLRLTVRPGGPRLVSTSDESGTPVLALPRGADRLTLAFEGLLTRTEGHPWLAVVAFLAALALGAGHAVAPGHGKTIMAFYLSGRRDGAWRSAATVGATVTATHTAGVLALGLLVSAGTAFVPARVYPWLGATSGLLVIAVGLTLLRNALVTRGHHHTHPHQHDHPHPHPHGHPHDQGQALDSESTTSLVSARRAVPLPHEPHEHGLPHHHDHRPGHEPSTPSRRGLIAMGLAGGLVPSPSALLVLLGAIALGHPWFGVALVIAFGLGMSATLAAVGLVVMRLRGRAESRLLRHPRSRFAPLVRSAPLVTASVVVLLGLGLAWRGFGAAGVL